MRLRDLPCRLAQLTQAGGSGQRDCGARIAQRCGQVCGAVAELQPAAGDTGKDVMQEHPLLAGLCLKMPLHAYMLFQQVPHFILATPRAQRRLYGMDQRSDPQRTLQKRCTAYRSQLFQPRALFPRFAPAAGQDHQRQIGPGRLLGQRLAQLGKRKLSQSLAGDQDHGCPQAHLPAQGVHIRADNSLQPGLCQGDNCQRGITPGGRKCENPLVLRRGVSLQASFPQSVAFLSLTAMCFRKRARLSGCRAAR